MKTKSDHDLQKDVMNELKWRFPVSHSEIGVSVKDGIVTLSGFADSYFIKREAERVTEKVEGVKAIVEKMEVKISGSGVRTDEDIAMAAHNALHWHVSIPDDKIKIIVHQGWITLEGDVNWAFQKRDAENAVESLSGVKGVTNSIHVKPKLKPSDVSEHINNAFRRNAQLDAAKITVEVDGNKAILRGKVRSYAEKKDAERAAWLTPGVTKVENHLDFLYEPVLT